MAVGNFSVPADVKEVFDKESARQNESAVLTELMRQAVEARRRRQRWAKAVEKVLALPTQTCPVTDGQDRSARRRGRP